jgi:hypothetical protein
MRHAPCLLKSEFRNPTSLPAIASLLAQARRAGEIRNSVVCHLSSVVYLLTSDLCGSLRAVAPMGRRLRLCN